MIPATHRACAHSLPTISPTRPLTAPGAAPGAAHALTAPEHSPRIALLGASFTMWNRGVDALAAGAIRCILHRFPQGSVFFLDYARAPRRFEVRADRRVVPVDLVPIRFSKNLFQRNHIARLLVAAGCARLLPHRYRLRVLAAHPPLRELAAATFAAALSGGDSFSDLYGLRRLLYVGLPQLLALVLRTPLVLLPQTIGPFRTRWSRAFARLVLRGAHHVFTREPANRDTVQRLLGRTATTDAVCFGPDVAFAVEPRAPGRSAIVGFPTPPPPGRPLVGLNVSGLLARGGYTGRNMFGLRDDYNRTVNSLIERLIDHHQAIVLLVPHSFGPPGSEADAPVCRQLYESFRTRYPDQVGWLAAEHAHDEIRHIVGRCDFFIGSRMHACIAALSQGVPVAAIAYSDKFRQTLALLDRGVTVLDARLLAPHEIVDGVSRALAGRTDAREALAPCVQDVQRQVLGLLDTVAPHPQTR